MNYRVHITIADRDWILEKCASEIAKRTSNVTYSETPDPTAEIQYYVNYSARKGRVSPIELAFFTHSEKIEKARARYFEAAREVDVAICMSRRYANELREAGIERVETIAPGVDLEEFRPKVRVGVVGRTYHTGRKGEALVASVMDTPGIEWKFTGQGWPGECTPVPAGGMADFYNSIDYLLIPAYFEGGPMSAIEALACGKPIISSDVGWVDQFPHIPFENGDAASLRSVLTSLVSERLQRAEIVRGHTWENWAQQHVALFDRLAAEQGIGSRESATTASSPPLKVVLATHSAEGKALGGPTVRIPRTAFALAPYGVDAVVQTSSGDEYQDRPIAHVFNVWPPRSALSTLLGMHAAGKSTVFSPIFLNLSNTKVFDKEIARIFAQATDDESIAGSLRSLAERVAQGSKLPMVEPFNGYHSKVRAAVDAADAVIVLSDYERDALAAIGADVSRAILVRNPVMAARFAAADPDLFAKTYGVRDYVLCVGRIEQRKNQLLVAHATRVLGLQAVFIGHEASAAYAKMVRQYAPPNALFLSRLDHDGPMLPSAYAGASVFCLPSWSEGAPLSAMEAAAAGAPLVLSDRSGEVEYFGDYAEYVNPADLDALKQALQAAMTTRLDTNRRRALQRHMAEGFSWEKYAGETAGVYRSLETPTEPIAPLNGRILIDLTTTYHFNGTPTGIARLEREVFGALVKIAPDRVQAVVWNSRSQHYLAIPAVEPPTTGGMDALVAMEASGEAHILTESDAPSGSYLLMVGGAWIRNARLGAAIGRVRSQLNLPFVVLVHDLIQSKLRSLYPPGAGEEFHRNASRIASIADAFLVYSEATRSDLRDLLREAGMMFKSIIGFKMGDTLTHASASQRLTDEPSHKIRSLRGKRYALFVSSVDPRKNHILLVNVWRRLIEQRGSGAPHLVLVGRPFWRGEEILDLIARDPSLSKHVHVFSDIEDDDLDWCYRNAAFTLFPSIYEGWGLPIAESLSYGKFCIASDASSTKEVAPGLTDLIDPYDFKAWLNRIALYFDNPAALAAKEAAIKAQYKPYAWSQAVGDIIRKVETIGLQPPGYFPIEPFSRLEVTRYADGMNHVVLGEGWDSPTAAGTAMTASEATLRFRYLGSGKSFWVRMHYAPTTGHRKLRVSSNGSEQSLDLPSRSRSTDFELSQPSDGSGDLSVAIAFKDGAPLLLTHLSFADTPGELELFGPATLTPRPDTPGRTQSKTSRKKGRRQPRKVSWLPNPPKRLSNRRFLYRALKAAQLEKPALRLYGALHRRIARAKRR